MTFLDKNQTLQAPADYVLDSVVADGGYIRLDYRQNIFKTGTETVIATNTVTIFLNDQGREVGRRLERRDFSFMLAALAKPEPKPVSRWFRIKNGFLIALSGIEEIFRCLKK